MLISYRKLVLLLFLLFTLTCTTGCGTYRNVTARTDPARPSFVFGGVSRDLGVLGVSAIFVLLDSESDDENDHENSKITFDEDDSSDDGGVFQGFFLFSLIDLPFSFVGDIVTLPVIISSDDRRRPRYDK